MRTVNACAWIFLTWRLHYFCQGLLVSSLSIPPADGISSSARRKIFTSASAALVASTAAPKLANASNQRSRSDGYAVQKSDSEWHSILSPTQYNILREGGTERPNFSILESEDRPGMFSCAGCATDLFESSQKFHSGTGWVSNNEQITFSSYMSTAKANLSSHVLPAIICQGYTWRRS